LSDDVVDLECVGGLCELRIALAGDVVLHVASSSPSDVTRRARNSRDDRRKGLGELEKMLFRGLKEGGRRNVGQDRTPRCFMFRDGARVRRLGRPGRCRAPFCPDSPSSKRSAGAMGHLAACDETIR
jgi:hypothetical protein